jgi:hypothetical protein
LSDECIFSQTTTGKSLPRFSFFSTNRTTELEVSGPTDFFTSSDPYYLIDVFRYTLVLDTSIFMKNNMDRREYFIFETSGPTDVASLRLFIEER